MLINRKVRDPEYNFAALWQIFREHYAFFDLHEVDWNAIYARFRPAIGPFTSEDELFETFSGMLAALDDGHVSLEAGQREFRSGKWLELDVLWIAEQGSSDWSVVGPGYEAAVKRHVEEEALDGEFRNEARGIITWGWAAPGVGYVNVAAMRVPFDDEEGDAEGDAEDEEHEVPLDEQLRLLDGTMARILDELGDAAALIVDARFNPGGEDAVALHIMGYLVDRERVAFTKKAVVGLGYAEPQPVTVNRHAVHTLPPERSKREICNSITRNKPGNYW